MHMMYSQMVMKYLSGTVFYTVKETSKKWNGQLQDCVSH